MRISYWSSDVCSSDLSQDAFLLETGDLIRLKAQEIAEDFMIMLADVGTWPSDLSRRFGNVGDDAGLQDRTKMGIVDFTHHAAGPILRVGRAIGGGVNRSEWHTSALQSLMRLSYAVLCLKKTMT